MSEIKDPTMTSPSPMENMRLEDAMHRLDELVSALDRENTDLEEALKLYEEGVRLVSVCHQKLADARRTIEILRITPDGEVIREPFAHKDDGAGE